ASRPALAQLVAGEAVAVDPTATENYRALVVPALEDLWAEEERPPAPRADPRLGLGRVQVLVFNQIIAGRTEQLPRLLPEIVYITLLPFVGHEEALRQAKLSGEDVEADA